MKKIFYLLSLFILSGYSLPSFSVGMDCLTIHKNETAKVSLKTVNNYNNCFLLDESAYNKKYAIFVYSFDNKKFTLHKFTAINGAAFNKEEFPSKRRGELSGAIFRGTNNRKTLGFYIEPRSDGKYNKNLRIEYVSTDNYFSIIIDMSNGEKGEKSTVETGRDPTLS